MKVYLAILDWFGNGDGIVIDSAWSSHKKAAKRLVSLEISEPLHSDYYVHTVEIDPIK